MGSRMMLVILSQDVIFDEDSTLHINVDSIVHCSLLYDLFSIISSSPHIIDED